MIEPGGEIVVYRSDDGRSHVQLRAVDGTIWLTQAEIAELYDTSVSNIAHIMRRVLDDGEVTQATIDSQSMVRAEGARQVRRDVKVYNLDMVLAVGYRATSSRAVQFRQWATTTLREYLVKGFVLDTPRLKNPSGFDHFDELLERIREIRASEKRFYQKVCDVFAATSADYDKDTDTARVFFATIQNKLIYAVTGRTAGELVLQRCDPAAVNLGLTTWSGARVRKKDVDTAKNYLTESEVTHLNRLTTMFLDFAENRAEMRKQTLMQDWVTQADRFLVFNEQTVLRGSGTVSTEQAKAVSAERYGEFDTRRRAQESRRSTEQEIDDLRALTEIERGRDDPDHA